MYVYIIHIINILHFIYKIKLYVCNVKTYVYFLHYTNIHIYEPKRFFFFFSLVICSLIRTAISSDYLFRKTDNKLSHILNIYYTAAQKFGISKIFNIFKGVSSAHQGCIYSIKNTEKICNIVKSYCNF